MARGVSAVLAVLLVLPSLLGGCASHPDVGTIPDPGSSTPPGARVNAADADAQHNGAYEGPVDEERIDALYDDLAQAMLDFESGNELLMAGQEVDGETRIANASNDLHRITLDCATVAGCDLDRFLDVYEYLMSEQNISLKKQRYRIETMESSIDEDAEREAGTRPFSGELPELTRSVSLLRGTDLRDLIELNGPVNAALDDWLTWLRPNLLDAWVNYQFLRPEIAPVYEDAGLPEALLFAMIATESGGKVHAVSRAGASGILQFMRYTGRKYGLGEEDGFDERFDPAAATRANVAYLNDHFAVFNNNLEKVLAAYNGGENRMRGLQRRYGDAPLWDRRVYYSLPRETREYVPRILAAAWLFLHPEHYQLEFPEVDPAVTELVLVADASVGELAICLGQDEAAPGGWFRTIRNLNPRVEPGDRVPAGTVIRVPVQVAESYVERCVGTEIAERALVLHEANYPEGPEMIPYVVRRGDTLSKIASRFRCATMGEIADLNRLRAPRYTIRVGQTLKIPACD